MGDRGNVCVMEGEGKVYLYTHWQGSFLKEIVEEALDLGRDRWGDGPYLTRIIFSTMIRDENPLSTTGYGISTYLVDYNHPTIFISIDRQKIWEGGDVTGPEEGVMGFEEFVEKNTIKIERKENDNT